MNNFSRVSISCQPWQFQQNLSVKDYEQVHILLLFSNPPLNEFQKATTLKRIYPILGLTELCVKLLSSILCNISYT